MSQELSRLLGYSFKNPRHLKMALTHRSSSDDNNERLEFLGDAIVNFVIAEALYARFPEAQEGELSRWRATLVNRDTIGEVARQFQLGRYLILGPGELKSGGNERLSILSCALEAIIGAIYLDGGFLVTQSCILRWYHTLLEAISQQKNHKDPKTVLQEYLQAKRMPLPIYSVEAVEGEAHRQFFTVSCVVDALGQKKIGQGSSRRRAEQEAALKMLEQIKK